MYLNNDSSNVPSHASIWVLASPDGERKEKEKKGCVDLAAGFGFSLEAKKRNEPYSSTAVFA